MTWLRRLLAALFGPLRFARGTAQRVQWVGLRSVAVFVGLLGHYVVCRRPETFDALDSAWAGRWLDVLTEFAWRHAPRAARALPPLGLKPQTLSEAFARAKAIGAILLRRPERPARTTERRRMRRARGRAYLRPAHAPRALALSG